jgi:hypothetical protein
LAASVRGDEHMSVEVPSRMPEPSASVVGDPFPGDAQLIEVHVAELKQPFNPSMLLRNARKTWRPR